MIHLRKIEPDDLPFLYQWENDASAWTDGSNHNPLSQFDLREYIQSSTGDIYKDGQLRLIVETAENPTITLGCVDLFDLDTRNLRAAVGIYLSPEHREKGYGTAALLQLHQYAFHFLHLRLLYAFVLENNIASQHLFDNAGYKPTTPLPHWTIESNATIWIIENKE